MVDANDLDMEALAEIINEKFGEGAYQEFEEYKESNRYEGFETMK